MMERIVVSLKVDGKRVSSYMILLTSPDTPKKGLEREIVYAAKFLAKKAGCA